jgi:anti-sigma factor RsiW
MSSDYHHIIPMLTRDNYEETFLLYVDNELTPEQRQAVEAFVLLHPDLKEELDLLCGTRLPIEAVSYQNTESLLADSMKVNTVDESLLLYIDNELPAWEKEAVEAQLQKDAAFATQHALLLKTKLQPDVISYPHKKELYRHTEKRIVPYWLRAAAVVLLMVGSGAAVWLNSDTPQRTNPDVAVATPDANKPAAQPVAPTPEAPAAVKDHNVAVEPQPQVTEKAVYAAKLPTVKKHTAKETFSTTHTAIPDAVASNPVPEAKKAEVRLETTATQETVQHVNNSAVTPDAVPSYVPLNDATAKTMVPVPAVTQTTTDERGGVSVKGFLRKATRFIERRTGIKTVNEDNELLVGAVALKL